MDEKDKAVITERYERRLSEYGAVPQALGWFKGRQNFRFHYLAGVDGLQPQDSILDVGCAFGDLFSYMRGRGWHGRYLGVDIVPGLIREGKDKYPVSYTHLTLPTN